MAYENSAILRHTWQATNLIQHNLNQATFRLNICIFLWLMCKRWRLFKYPVTSLTIILALGNRSNSILIKRHSGSDIIKWLQIMEGWFKFRINSFCNLKYKIGSREFYTQFLYRILYLFVRLCISRLHKIDASMSLPKTTIYYFL